MHLQYMKDATLRTLTHFKCDPKKQWQDSYMLNTHGEYICYLTDMQSHTPFHSDMADAHLHPL